MDAPAHAAGKSQLTLQNRVSIFSGKPWTSKTCSKFRIQRNGYSKFNGSGWSEGLTLEGKKEGAVGDASLFLGKGSILIDAGSVPQPHVPHGQEVLKIEEI